MADSNEKPFETEICEHLASHGWLYSPTSAGYDKTRALFPEDVLGWLADTQPEELAKVVTPGAPDEAKQRDLLLDRLVKVLDDPLEQGGGTLNLLRHGFKQVAARFEMCQFKPETSLNAQTLQRYGKVRLRVVRQVFFSTADRRSIDLVFFVNGLPVATAELKTDFTQSVQEAIDQYKLDRRPRHPSTGHVEPLLGFGSRALVHFAVSNDEVHMTTRLAGPDTRFLPFNRGDDDGAGNPLNPHGSRTSYLWEQVLARDSWLTILGKFLHLQHTQRTDPISGKTAKSSTLLFPRYHQWESVTALVEAARTEGPGHRYLIQHSAGSGKTNSIAWTAHRLATLHREDDSKVFDSVIVVTDRNVLDAQLQEAVRQIEGNKGVVVTVDREQAAREGLGAKSTLLARALTDSTLIVVVTIQTFPHAMEAIRSNATLKGKTFAVIADEAHSSQAGATAIKLKEVLTAEELADLEDGGELDTEALLAADMTDRASTPNVSYFAYTATPKPKTLELFGRPGPDGKPQPFHRYAMRQAIEEGYILDVLQGFHSYDTAFQIAQRATNGKLKAAGEGQEPQPDEELVDQAAATKGLMRWVKLHPTNIGQKVQIVVEHFRSNLAGLLDGHAKAMVVTDSRKAAVRYKVAIDAYFARQGYTEMAALVAFSGEVSDPELRPDTCTEANMNPRLKGRDLRTAFATDEFQVMIVANKFQTGFDQPLLVAMYVDKRLAGVSTVQTLSRLNRTYVAPSGEVKDTTFVLDFVNSPEDVRRDFEPYFETTVLEQGTDPNKVHDLATKLDQAGIYTDGEIDALVGAWLRRKGNSALAAAIGPAKQRFAQRYQAGVQAEDTTAIDELDLFRKDVGTFVRLYDFLSQIIDYGDTSLEKRAIFLRLLERQIRPDNYSAAVDLGEVRLLAARQLDRGSVDIKLGTERIGLRGSAGAGTATSRDPHLVLLQEIIDRLNDLFGSEEFTQAQQASWLESLLAALLEDQQLLTQAKVNSKQQFLDSPDLRYAVVGAVLSVQTSHNKMADVVSGSGEVESVLVESLGELLHLHAQAPSPG